MPVKNKTVRRGRKRNKRNNKVRKQQRSIFMRPVGGFLLNNEYKVCLRVSEYFGDTSSGDSLQYVFLANSLYNPYATYASTQPAGFSYYMSAYLKYRVLACQIRIRSINTTSSGEWISLYPSLEPIPFTTIVQSESQKYSKLMMCGSKDSTPKISLVKTCSSQMIFGHNPNLDEDFSGDFGSSPPFKWYWVINFYVPGGTVVTSCVIDMKFNIIFYGRKTQDLSTPSLLSKEIDSPFYNKFLNKQSEQKTGD